MQCSEEEGESERAEGGMPLFRHLCMCYIVVCVCVLCMCVCVFLFLVISEKEKIGGESERERERERERPESALVNFDALLQCPPPSLPYTSSEADIAPFLALKGAGVMLQTAGM